MSNSVLVHNGKMLKITSEGGTKVLNKKINWEYPEQIDNSLYIKQSHEIVKVNDTLEVK